jgi:hypothetical protein
MSEHRVVRRILVIANETIEGRNLHDVITARHDTEILLVAPALTTRARLRTSDEDRARREAEARLGAGLAAVDAAGIHVTGWLGDADPMQAIADALVAFPADELLIATHPEDRSNWLADDLVPRACGRFQLPVAHIVVDHADLPSPVAAAAAAA